jgi:hypothetical protein
LGRPNIETHKNCFSQIANNDTTGFEGDKVERVVPFQLSASLQKQGL